jgi:hypothetical protein
VKAWVSRTAMNSQEIEIGVKASKYGIFLVIFHEIGGCGCQEMGARHSEEGKERVRTIGQSYPYLPASVKVSRGKPRPTAAICARPSTLWPAVSLFSHHH